MNPITRITTALLDALHAAPDPFLRLAERLSWRKHRAAVVAELAAGLGLADIEDEASALHSTLCRPITDPEVRALLEAGGATPVILPTASHDWPALWTDADGVVRDAAGFRADGPVFETPLRPRSESPAAPAHGSHSRTQDGAAAGYPRCCSADAPADRRSSPHQEAHPPAEGTHGPTHPGGSQVPAPLP